MSIPLESAAEALAQAVVVDELASTEGRAAGAAPTCANCGAALRGAFCHQCGQKAHLHHSLLHMAEEFLHGLLHFDTKAWRTLPALLWNPGRLTRAYLDGQRMRYVSPLALYLFLVFLLFFVLSLTSSGPQVGQPVSAKDLAKARAELALEEARVAAERKDATAGATGVEDSALMAARIQVQALEGELKRAEAASAAGGAGPARVDDRASGRALFADLKEDLRWLDHPVVERKLVHAFENKELTIYKIKSSFSKFAFLLMPLALPFLWLLFAWQRRHTMFDHAVFALYSLSAMALLGVLLLLLAAAGAGGLAGWLFVCLPPLHMYRQLKGTYGLGRWAALWRTGALLMIAGASLLLYMLLVVLVSM